MILSPRAQVSRSSWEKLFLWETLLMGMAVMKRAFLPPGKAPDAREGGLARGLGRAQPMLLRRPDPVHRHVHGANPSS